MADWGIIPELNPGAVLALSEGRSRPHNVGTGKGARNLHSGKQTFDADSLHFDAEHLEKIQINLNDWLTHKPGGRATAVLGSSESVLDDASYGELACKISFPEIARGNEGEIIKRLRQLIEGDSETKQLSKHLPEVLMYGDMSRYGTQRIRSMLKSSIAGSRVLVLKKMAPLTSLAGARLVKAWLDSEVVKCMYMILLCLLVMLKMFPSRCPCIPLELHLEHGDPSLWNVMYNEDLQCGVLSDFDLSVSQRQRHVPGTDRTGTIPFMAIALLADEYIDEYWHGGME